MNKMKITALLGSALLLCGGQAQAEYTWSFGGSTSESSVLGNTVTKGSTITATAQAWANTNDGAGSSSKGSTSSSTAESYKLETAYLNIYSGGLGVKNQDATSSSSTTGDNSEGGYTFPAEHTTDNNQRYDSVLFSFSSAIDLNSVTIGFKDNDSDITVLAYTGNSCSSGTCSSSLSGKTYSELVSYGWELIGQYTDLAINTAKAVNAGNVASSLWLIGAANTMVGGSKDTSKDYVKLLALAGDKYAPPPPPPPPGVPEPGTLLLMSAGLIGLARYNKRRTRA